MHINFTIRNTKFRSFKEFEMLFESQNHFFNFVEFIYLVMYNKEWGFK